MYLLSQNRLEMFNSFTKLPSLLYLYLFQLTFLVNEEVLREIFSKFGQLKDVIVKKHALIPVSVHLAPYLLLFF